MDADIDELVEPIVVLNSKFVETQQEDIPDYYWPVTGKWRIRGKLNGCLIENMH